MQHIHHSILFLICLTVLFASFVGAQEKRSSDLFVVIVNDNRGFIDRTGKIVIEPQWGGANDFSEGRAVIAVNSPKYKLGYIDETGKVVIETKFDYASDFHDGIALVGIGTFGMHGSGDHKFGFIDKNGKWLIEPKYKEAYGFFEGLAAVMNDEGKWGFIDITGKVVIPFQFETGSSFSEGLASVFVKDKYGYIDKTGKIIIKPQFTQANNFSEGLAVVKIGGVLSKPYGATITKKGEYYGKFVYIDKTGKVTIQLPQNTEGAGNFSEGLASLEIKKKDGYLYNGYIDKSGKFVIEPTFGIAENFSDGVARVITDNGFGFIDKTGKLFFECKYPSECAMVNDFENGLAWIQKGGEDAFKNFQEAKYGYIDKTGKVIWQPTK